MPWQYSICKARSSTNSTYNNPATRRKNKQANKQKHTQATIIVCTRYNRTTWREADGLVQCCYMYNENYKTYVRMRRSPTCCYWKEEGHYNHCPKAYAYYDPSLQSRHRSLKSSLTFICYGGIVILHRFIYCLVHYHLAGVPMHFGHHLMFSSNHTCM